MMTINEFLALLKNVQKSGSGWTAICPGHSDNKNSLSIGYENGKILLYCHSGCSVNNICAALGLELKDLFEERQSGNKEIIAAYDYKNASGKLLYQVVRFEPKDFQQRRPDGNGGWIWNTKGITPLPYRLPELLKTIEANETIYITEGEKDVKSLRKLGLPATCNHGGAGKWKQAHSKYFVAGTNVIIIPDNDDPGRKHGQQIANQLAGKGCLVKVLELPGAKDVSDWLVAGGTKEELLKLVAQAPEWKPSEIEQGGKEEEAKEEKPSQADILIYIAITEAFLFHDETKDGFVALPINGHRETWPLQSKFFKQWLVKSYYEQTGKSPNNEAIRQALNVIEAKAVFDGPEIRLNLRVAEHDGALWYDLANDAWQVIKITPDAWQVVDNPPILFRRYKNTAPQVLPRRGGKLDLLKKYVNLKDESDRQLLFAQITHAFIPNVSHGIPNFHGDKGSAKTMSQRAIRKLIDPAHRDTMTLPNDKNELALMLMTNYAPCFDNLDNLSPWQSDMLWQAATGGGISKRELYTNMEEVILSFLRCPMLNGINLVAGRDDLLDRSVLFRLERIDKEGRKTEAEFWQELEVDRPYILGTIFDVLAKALRIYPNVKLPALPRVADFATWGYAAMEAVGGMGEAFLKAYHKNISGAVEESVIGDITGSAIVEFIADKNEWQGTATELLKTLNDLPSVNEKDRAWPKRPNTLARRLNRIKSALADYGIKVEGFQDSTLTRTRFLKISKNIVQIKILRK